MTAEKLQLLPKDEAFECVDKNAKKSVSWVEMDAWKEIHAEFVRNVQESQMRKIKLPRDVARGTEIILHDIKMMMMIIRYTLIGKNLAKLAKFYNNIFVYNNI